MLIKISKRFWKNKTVGTDDAGLYCASYANAKEIQIRVFKDAVKTPSGKLANFQEKLQIVLTPDQALELAAQLTSHYETINGRKG